MGSRSSKHQQEAVVVGASRSEIDRSVRHTMQQLVRPARLLTTIQRCHPNQDSDTADFVPIDLTFLPNGDLAVVNSSNNCLEIYDKRGELIRDFQQDLKIPRNVTMTRDGRIVVTDCGDKSIKTFSQEGDLYSTWTHKQLKQPHGVAEIHDGRFVVTDSSRNTVTIHDTDGKLFSKLDPKLAHLKTFSNPCYVDVNGRNQIVFADAMNHLVHVYTAQGGIFVESFETHDDLYIAKKNIPNGICVDWNDNVIVADWKNKDRMVSLRTQDKKVISLLTKDQVQSPRGLAFDPLTGRLAVAEYSAIRHFKPKVQIFQMYKKT